MGTLLSQRDRLGLCSMRQKSSLIEKGTHLGRSAAAEAFRGKVLQAYEDGDPFGPEEAA